MGACLVLGKASSQRPPSAAVPKNKIMNVDELLDGIRKRPNFYLENQKSLRILRSFLVGFDYGLSKSGNQPSVYEQLRHFNDWVSVQLGFGESTGGWCNMIVSKAGSDEKAFDLFFELFDKYRMDNRS